MDEGEWNKYSTFFPPVSAGREGETISVPGDEGRSFDDTLETTVCSGNVT